MPARSRFAAHFSHVLLVLSGMLLMALAHYLFFPRTGRVWNLSQSKNSSAPAGTRRIPPWGKVEYIPLALDRPEDYFTNTIERPLKTRWVLRKSSEQEVAELFGSLQLSEPARSFLLDRSHWEHIADTFQIAPPPEVVINLPLEARGKLYTELAQYPENVPQRIPFTFRKDGFDDWFAECGLAKEKIDLVRKLSFVKDDNLCFSDASVFGEVSTPAETTCLLKSLWRVSTFIMRIKIDSETDIDALLNYWGKAGPAQVYKPLLESMSRVAEGSSINISYFLPSFARLHLYTYPRPEDSQSLQQDCFWSAMNFFNEEPDDRLFNPDFKDKQLLTEYYRVPEKEKRFGDLLLLLGPGQNALHMCVYLADEVVFTKNGANAIQPWVLMKVPEMLAIYQRLRPFDIIFYRKKDLPVITASGSLQTHPQSD